MIYFRETWIEHDFVKVLMIHRQPSSDLVQLVEH